MDQVIVVGGGLAGMSAAHTVLERGGRVLLIDKNAFCGGNSTKATSGINGALTKAQRNKKIPDSPEIFEEDCMRGGANRPDLVKVLAHESAPAVDWLIDEFNLDLSLIARLGGHSQPRTHRGKTRFPGMTITYALIDKLEQIAESKDGRARMIMKARATKLLFENGTVVGLEFEKDGKAMREFGSVILATGGFGADFTEGSLLKKHRPDLMALPTTNGDHCTGDGLKMAAAVGADMIDLEWVQVHPTGLVHPDEPDAKLKFLAAEALRGVGGLLLDAEGNRFSNELGRRDYVTGMMWKNKGPFRLVLNSKASKEIEWHCKHYKGRGLMKFFSSGSDLAKEMNISPSVLDATFKDYNEAAAKCLKDPEGGPYDAYPSGKSWDKHGKKFFHNLPMEVSDSFHVAIVTPVIHYCMGGLKVDAESQVLHFEAEGRRFDPPNSRFLQALTPGNEKIPGLFGAGEVIGGVHGKNRLGGNSLLDCVVYGRVAARTAAKDMMSKNIQVLLANKMTGEKGAKSKL